MSRRTEQRQAAVFVIYQHELTGRDLSELFERNASLFTRSLAHSTYEHIGEFDDLIAEHSAGWSLNRIAPLEKAIMRVALLEMLYPGIVDGDKPIPAEGAISEAIDTAKEFCGNKTPGFINGILAAILRDQTGEEVSIKVKQEIDTSAAKEISAEDAGHLGFKPGND